MLESQFIYKAIDFVFTNGDKPKPKFFIVFHCNEENVLLLSLTTSVSKLPSDLDTLDITGCVHFNDNRGYGHSFIWNNNEVIGKNGFKFELRTYIQLEFRSHLIEEGLESFKEKFVSKRIDICDCLTDDEFCKLLK